MSTSSTAIRIPRLPAESSRAYSARVAYITMGTGRSLDAAAQKLGKSPNVLARWSTEYEWVESARRYDEAVAHIAIQESVERYKAELEEHRQRYRHTGKALHEVAASMLDAMEQSVKDGTAKAVEYTPQSLQTIARAILVAADLEAHALDLPRLMAALEPAKADD